MPLLARLLAIALFALPGIAPGKTLIGKVVNVAERDTVTVLVDKVQHRIRLQGTDAPERGQPYGKASGRSLSKLVSGKTVRVYADKVDRYGHLVGTLLAPAAGATCSATDCSQWLDAGYFQVATGMAWHFKRYAHEQSPDAREAYAKAQEVAVWNGVGCGRSPMRCCPGSSGRSSGHPPRNHSLLQQVGARLHHVQVAMWAGAVPIVSASKSEAVRMPVVP